MKVTFIKIAEAFNYNFLKKVQTRTELIKTLGELKSKAGPSFLEICVKKGGRDNLGRPDKSPQENKIDFMKNLAKEITVA